MPFRRPGFFSAHFEKDSINGAIISVAVFTIGISAVPIVSERFFN
nr:MAG TPA: hypothetical protein [Caudoviricetes sp.]